MGKLTARKVETLGAGKWGDGGGLWLAVSPTGAKKWVLRLTVNGKRREMGLGAYPEVSLAKARSKALDARRVLEEGADPIAARLAAKQIKTTPTFTEAAARYIRAHRRGWRNRKHARQWVSTLKTYARPILGKKPVDQIETEDVLRVLQQIWTTKTETAKRVQTRMENILDWAAANGYREPVNPARWRGHLSKLLPKPSKVRRVEHHPAMPYREVPAFLTELDGKDGFAARALRFLILTGCRTGEVLKAQWSEIDLEAAIWTIPAARMKAGREHRVPLTEAALDLLGALPKVSGEAWIFPGQRAGRPLSPMALLKVMRDLGYGVGGHRGAYVPHGFRSSFRDWAAEQTSFPRELAEAALAHVNPNVVERAYQRGDLFERRRELMNAWSAFIQPTGGNVIALLKRTA